MRPSLPVALAVLLLAAGGSSAALANEPVLARIDPLFWSAPEGADGGRVPVLVAFEHGVGSNEGARRFTRALPEAAPWHVLKLASGIATSLDAREAAIASRLPFVRWIEYDSVATENTASADLHHGVSAVRDHLGYTGGDADDRTHGVNDITVAVIDSGFDDTHVELEGRFLALVDVGGAGGIGTHGTKVAGVLGARGVDPEARGVAPGAALIGIRIANVDMEARQTSMIRAFEWIVAYKEEHRIRIAITSYGFEEPTPAPGADLLEQTVTAAWNAGIFLVMAGGNEGPAFGTIERPADAEIVTVGNVADPGGYTITNGNVYAYNSPPADIKGFRLIQGSARGPTTWGKTAPTILATGAGLRMPSAGTTNAYVTDVGTSFAAPYVAGVAALMLQVDPTLTNVQLRDILTATAQDWNKPGPDNDTGYGLLRARDAVNAVFSGTPPASPPPPVQAHAVDTAITGYVPAGGGFMVTNTSLPLALTFMTDAGGPIEQATLRGPTGPLGATQNVFGYRHHGISAFPPVPGEYRWTVTASYGTRVTVDVSHG